MSAGVRGVPVFRMRNASWNLFRARNAGRGLFRTRNAEPRLFRLRNGAVWSGGAGKLGAQCCACETLTETCFARETSNKRFACETLRCPAYRFSRERIRRGQA